MQESELKSLPENICKCCGLCCLCKIQLDSALNSPIYLTSVACNYLDLETKKCTCYETRYHEDNGCGDLYIKTIKDKNLVPRCCEYSKYILGEVDKKYIPKIDWSQVIHEKDIPFGKTLKDYILTKKIDFFKGEKIR